MNKSALIDAIARHADISKAAAGRALEATVNAIKGSLRKGEVVTLVGFGSFHVGKRTARAGTKSADGRDDQDPRREGAEVPRWQSTEGCCKLISLFTLRGEWYRGTGAARVLSSAGRASPLQGECRRFDPVSTHQEQRARTGSRRSGSSVG